MSLRGELQREVPLRRRPQRAHQVPQGAVEEAADLHPRHQQEIHLWEEMRQQERVQ